LQPEPAITENPARVILVVEDNAADVRLIRDALASCTAGGSPTSYCSS